MNMNMNFLCCSYEFGRCVSMMECKNHGPIHFTVYFYTNYSAIYNYISLSLLLLGLYHGNWKINILTAEFPSYPYVVPFVPSPLQPKIWFFDHSLYIHAGQWFCSLTAPEYRRDKRTATAMCCLSFSVDTTTFIWDSAVKAEVQKLTAICQNLVHDCL